MLATLFFFFFDVFVFVDDSTSPLLLLTNFMNSYVTHNFPPNVIGFINALSVKLSANATVNRVGSAFANIGMLLTAERAGPLELSSIFTNTGCTFFLIASMFAKGWQIVLDGDSYAATHVDAAKVMEKPRGICPARRRARGKGERTKIRASVHEFVSFIKTSPEHYSRKNERSPFETKENERERKQQQQKKRRTKRTRTPKVRLWPLTLGLRSVA